MTPGEFKEIAKAMKEYGITNVKMGDCEFSIAHPLSLGNQPVQNHTVSTDPSDPIKHKVDQMASLMKLSDTDLVDQLFPDKSEEAI